jgi:hypothetical protein
MMFEHWSGCLRDLGVPDGIIRTVDVRAVYVAAKPCTP